MTIAIERESIEIVFPPSKIYSNVVLLAVPPTDNAPTTVVRVVVARYK